MLLEFKQLGEEKSGVADNYQMKTGHVQSSLFSSNSVLNYTIPYFESLIQKMKNQISPILKSFLIAFTIVYCFFSYMYLFYPFVGLLKCENSF